jgi:hypothetical protein
MGQDDEAVIPPVRGIRDVISRRKRGDRLGELVGESGSIGRGAKANLGVNRERGEGLFSGGGSANELAHLAHRSGSESDEVAPG